MESEASAEWTVFHRLTAAEKALSHNAAGQIFLVEGLIGSGKTTLVEALADFARRRLNLDALALTEGMRAPLLQYFCEDMKQHAALTQNTMLMKRFIAVIEATRHAARGGVVFMDRSLGGDYAFALMHRGDGNMSPQEFALYEDERDAMAVKLKLNPAVGLWQSPAAALDLTVPDDVLKQRITRRGNPAEIQLYIHDDPLYFERLRKAYGAALTPDRLECPIVALDWLDAHPWFSLDDDACAAILWTLVKAGNAEPAPAPRRRLEEAEVSRVSLDWGHRLD